MRCEPDAIAVIIKKIKHDVSVETNQFLETR